MQRERVIVTIADRFGQHRAGMQVIASITLLIVLHLGLNAYELSLHSLNRVSAFCSVLLIDFDRPWRRSSSIM